MTKVTFYNLSVSIETSDYNLLSHIKEFLDKNYTSKTKGFNAKAGLSIKLFASKIKDRPIYYMHFRQFLHLYKELEAMGYSFNNIEKEDKREYAIEVADMSVRDNWELRDYQKPIVDFLLDNPVKSKLVPLRTGGGKSVIAMFAIANLKQRMAMVIPPVFIEKWVLDIANIHNANVSDVMVIQGFKALAGLIDMAKSNSLTNNYYIFSNRTLQEFITQYEQDPELCVSMYGCEPIDLFPLLGIGVLLVDETHMQYHSLFKILIHTNVKYLIGLTATLLSDDYIVRKMHKIVYPDNCIYKDANIVKYADVYAISYTIPPNLINKVKTTNFGSKVYSHIAFEQSIMRRKELLEPYIKIIVRAIEDYYIPEYRDKDKLLIFVSTIKFASMLTEVLREKYSQFTVNRYCEDDPYDNLMNSDIIVSTIISSGTGVDIPNLRVCIQTVSIASQVANIQSLGRLRQLPDRDVKFCYLYCNNIPKHKEYHLRRMDLFKPRVATISLRNSGVGFN